MKLITKQIENLLSKYPLRSQDGKRDNALVLAKFFMPSSAFTFYMLEGDISQQTAYGIIVGFDNSAEYGYISLNEMQTVRNRLGLGVERDMYFNKCKVSEIEDSQVKSLVERLWK